MSTINIMIAALLVVVVFSLGVVLAGLLHHVSDNDDMEAMQRTIVTLTKKLIAQEREIEELRRQAARAPQSPRRAT